VIIVSYRTPTLTAAAVQSALDAGAARVVIVDNGSGDDTERVLRTLGAPRMQLLERPVNGGYGTGANAGATLASEKTLIFLNSDAILDSEAANALVREVELHGGRCIAAPRLVSGDGAVQRSAGLLPSPGDLMVRALALHEAAKWLGRLPLVRTLAADSHLAREYYSAVRATQTISTTMVSGACIAIGREAFEELGGFDERFFLYFEDADLCRRAAAAGMPIRYVPDAVVTHIGGASSSEDYHFGPLHARAMRQYLGKWYGPGGSALALALLWLRAVGISVALRPGARRAWRAWWAAVRDEDPRR
jgi:N-acetylglucosaminyl-diphospho-decaprenol L-rhamnosyltransferase